MEHLKINSIKNNQDNSQDLFLRKVDRDYISNFIKENKEEFKKKHFEIFLDYAFLEFIECKKVFLFIKFLLDVSEYYTLNFINSLLDFSPFTNSWYVNLYEMQIDKMQIEWGYLSYIRLENTNISELTCTPQSIADFRDLCYRCDYSVIDKVIINENGNFNESEFKEIIEIHLDGSSFQINEFIFK